MGKREMLELYEAEAWRQDDTDDEDDDSDDEYETDSSDDSSDEEDFEECERCCQAAVDNPVLEALLPVDAADFLDACVNEGCNNNDCGLLEDELLQEICEFGAAVLDDDDGKIVFNAGNADEIKVEFECEDDGDLELVVSQPGEDDEERDDTCARCCALALDNDLIQAFADDLGGLSCGNIGCDENADCDDLSGTAEDLCLYVRELAADGEGTFDWELEDDDADRTLSLNCGDAQDTAFTFTQSLVGGSGGSNAGVIVGAIAGVAAVVAGAVVVFRRRNAQPAQAQQQNAEVPPKVAVVPEAEAKLGSL